MAAGAFAVFAHPFVVPVIQFQSGNTYAVVVTSQASRPLLDALKTLLANLDSAYGSKGAENPNPATAVTPETIQANVASIATLVGPSGSQAVARLGTDVDAVISAGTFTAQTRAAVATDVRSILVGEGISTTLLLPAIGSIPGPGRPGSPELVLSRRPDRSERDWSGCRREHAWSGCDSIHVFPDRLHASKRVIWLGCARVELPPPDRELPIRPGEVAVCHGRAEGSDHQGFRRDRGRCTSALARRGQGASSRPSGRGPGRTHHRCRVRDHHGRCAIGADQCGDLRRTQRPSDRRLPADPPSGGS